MINVSPIISLKGSYKLYIGKKYGGRRRLVAEFDNLILDAGLNRLGTGKAFDYVLVGTGTSTPTVNQTALDAFRAYQTLNIGTDTFVDGSSPYCQQTWTARFLAGAASGNLAEIGVGWSATNTNLFSRARIVDNNGDPTTITVRADEYLDVEYTIKMYCPTQDYTGTLVISGSTYNWVARASAINQWSARIGGISSSNLFPQTVIPYSGNIGTIYQAPNGAPGTSKTTSALTYSNNSYQGRGKFDWGLSDANIATGIKSFLCYIGNYANARYQLEITPEIPKDATKTLSLTFSINWARH